VRRDTGDGHRLSIAGGAGQVRAVATLAAVEPILTFKSHINGKNADVAVYSDRIEWAREGFLGRGAKLALGAATLGTSLLKTGVGGKTQGTEMIPVKSISSVTTERDGCDGGTAAGGPTRCPTAACRASTRAETRRRTPPGGGGVLSLAVLCGARRGR